MNQSKIVHIGNLPFDCTEDDIRNHLKSIGTIENIILEQFDQGKFKRSYAFVAFQNPAQAQKAIDDFDETIFNGKVISVTPRTKSARKFKGMSALDGAEMRSPPKTRIDQPKEADSYSSDSYSPKPRRHRHHHHKRHHHHRHHTYSSYSD